ncbi:PREDICTED: probable RNA methyltransferase CG11342 [Dinoponera quadriceps]|uniref:RNA methyltransferase n=1 Tax=Dinoponera quadriceps TaxID=609295 RepID=A0A6P3XF28_DINQU|nr:PREDICTED: probable RNA methyltransferase CG11342 [Dinoponera quadriceps]
MIWFNALEDKHHSQRQARDKLRHRRDFPANVGMSDARDTDDERNNDTKTNPGASRHGNFMNYYQFHPAEERMRQLPHGVWRLAHPARKYAGLDVGCNAGDLTYILYDFLEKIMKSQDQPEISLFGVDLDPILIERARERNLRPDRVTFECLNFLSKDCSETLTRYLDQLDKSRFDVVFCFSITMWIHLNHGDDGLEEFLRKACALAEMIVIEPQPWRCYRNASRRLKRAKSEDFPLLKGLKYTGDLAKHIENIITRLCNFRKVVVTESNGWGRKLLIYERKQQNQVINRNI